MITLERFIDQYVEALFFTEEERFKEEGGKDTTFAPETWAKIQEECANFYGEFSPLFDTPSPGIDFWLTRNHHGAGFWDKETPNCDALTKASHAFGTAEPYIGDDGLIYIF